MGEGVVLYLLRALARIPGAVFIFTFRGFCQAFSSDRLGDPTPRKTGQLSFNPLKHIDIFGFICILIFGIGWCKPVTVNSSYYKHIKRDSAIQILSGPLGCILGGFVLSLFYVVTCGIINANPFAGADIASGIGSFAANVFFYGLQMGVFLGLFYLLPVPGFDGFRLIVNFLPARCYHAVYKIEKYSIFFFMGVILLLNTSIGSIILYTPAGILINAFISLFRMIFNFMF